MGGGVAKCLNAGPTAKHDPSAETYVVGTISAESFTGGPSGRPEGAAAGHFIPVVAGTSCGGSRKSPGSVCGQDATQGLLVTGTLTGSQAYSGLDENDAARGMYVTHALRGEGFDASEDGTGRGTPLVAFSSVDHGQDAGEISPTLRSLGHFHANSGSQVAVTVALRGREGVGVAELGGEIANALQSAEGGGNKAHVLANAVRRLMPIECERLQGIPDNYTLIPWRGGMAPDGPRYKAIGNGMAVPCIGWVIAQVDRAIRMFWGIAV